jgi:hypothetical protein
MSGGYGRRISKADPDPEARSRTLARVGQVGNGIAIVGGVHALHQANSNFMRVKRGLDPAAAAHGPSLIARKAPKLAAKLKDPKVALGVAGAGVGLHVAELGGDAISHHFLHQAGKKQPVAKLEGREFNRGRSYEQIAAEGQRRRTAVSGAAYGGVASGAALAGSAIGNAKIAGTRAGQHSLTQLQSRLHHTGNPLAHQVGQIKRLGVKAAEHKGKTSVALGAATAVAGGAKVMERFRTNEEAGMSQGIGRMKAGSAYGRAQSRVSKVSPLRTALLMSDADLTHPAVVRTARIAQQHGRKIAAGTAGTGVAGIAAQGVRGTSRRKQEREALRSQIVKRSDLEVHDRSVSPVRLAGAGLGGGALLYGIPRLRTTSNVVAYGRNHPERQVRTAANAAHRMAQGAAAVSSPLGPTASRTLALSPFTRPATRLPRSWRAGAATLAGAALLKGSLPIHTDRYRQVTGIPQRGVV